MKYIAYGSNMVQEQMDHRCPHAHLIGLGHLPNCRLEFYVHATVDPDFSCPEGVPVAVWEIDSWDEANLDYYEGYPDYYKKMKATVAMQDGSQIEGMIYIMNEGAPYPPYDWYYKDIVIAYEQLGFASEIDTVLEPALQRSKNRH